jgi:hypothetical protein
MAQTILTPTELTRRFLDVMHSNCVVVRNMNHEYEKDFGTQSGFDGQKIGPTLTIRKPDQFSVRSAWAMGQQDLTGQSATLTVDTVRGIDVNFPDASMATDVDDYTARYIVPQAKRLAAEVDKVAAAYIKNHTYQLGGTIGTQPNTALIFANAAKKIKNQLVPIDGDINAIICPDTEAALVGGMTPLQFNPASAISKMWSTGQMSDMLGFNWYMSQVLTSHLTGTRTETTPAAAAITVNGQATMTITNGGNGLTWKEGDVFTVAGCYDVNPETKQTLANLKQFRVTTANACDTSGNVTLAIAPAVYLSSSPLQNVSAFPGGALVNQTAGGSGAANTTYSNDLIFHKKAFAFASAPLIIPGGVMEAATASQDGLNIRYVKAYDIVNAKVLSRMDIFFGMCELRP